MENNKEEQAHNLLKALWDGNSLEGRVNAWESFTDEEKKIFVTKILLPDRNEPPFITEYRHELAINHVKKLPTQIEIPKAFRQSFDQQQNPLKNMLSRFNPKRLFRR